MGTAVVTKTWFSQMIGDESPFPGTSTFHLTFLVLLHSIGGDALGAVPFPVGPRQWAQLSAAENDTNVKKTTAKQAAVFKIGNPHVHGPRIRIDLRHALL